MITPDAWLPITCERLRSSQVTSLADYSGWRGRNEARNDDPSPYSAAEVKDFRRWWRRGAHVERLYLCSDEEHRALKREAALAAAAHRRAERSA